MSIQALGWAFDQNLKPHVKFVLVALANIAGGNDEAYPSVAHLAAATSEDRKTVIAALDVLEQGGLIADTGKREGRTRQIKVYRLIRHQVNGAADATLRDGETVPPTRANSTVFPSKESRGRDTEPSRNHKKEPMSSEANASGAEAPAEVNSIASLFPSDPPAKSPKPVDDVAAVIFGQGLDWLMQRSGKSRTACAPLLGRWRKQIGDAALVQVLGAAQREGPIEPIGWLTKAVAARSRERPAETLGWN